MEERKEMDTVSSVMNNLKQQGKDNEFTVHANGLVLLKGNVYDHRGIGLREELL